MQEHKSVLEKSLFSLSWPIFIDILLHMSTLFINTYMISHVSISMVAATTVGSQFFDIFIPIFNFIGIGCSVVIAQYLGAGNRNQARYALHLSISFNFVLGLICYLFISLFGYTILQVMNTPEAILDMSYDYFHILGICLIFESVVIILASCLRVYGKPKSSMYVSIIMNIITVLGNASVLYGLWGMPELGLVGVAWSTVVGRIVGLILLFSLLFFGLHIKVQLSLFWQWNKQILKQICKIGLPSAGENLSWSGQILVMTAFIGLLGEEALAAQAIFFQIAYFMMLFAISISVGNEIMVGHLVGAKRFDDAYHRTWRSLWIGIIVTFIVVTFFYCFRETIVTSITGDMGVADIILPIFLLSFILEPGRTQNIVMVNALRATGDAKFPFYTALIFMWGVAIPIGYLLGITCKLGLLGIWIGFACDEWIRGLVNTYRWKSRKWESKRLDVA
ncbi:MATE family efflux transporter [Orbaceae bacterium ESL0721]|nr:MATE family efflux transporter [Orbaceae bacterium ESL0721]